MNNIVILKLSKEQLQALQEMVHNGWATEFEKTMYYNCYNLNDQDVQESVKSFL